MNNAEWIRKYYPIPASECPEEKALDHSLQKWLGALDPPESGHLPVEFGAETCALCHYYLDSPLDTPLCCKCPLYTLRGYSCDSGRTVQESPKSEYRQWITVNNPYPMIKLLRAAITHRDSLPADTTGPNRIDPNPNETESKPSKPTQRPTQITCSTLT